MNTIHQVFFQSPLSHTHSCACVCMRAYMFLAHVIPCVDSWDQYRNQDTEQMLHYVATDTFLPPLWTRLSSVLKFCYFKNAAHMNFIVCNIWTLASFIQYDSPEIHPNHCIYD